MLQLGVLCAHHVQQDTLLKRGRHPAPNAQAAHLLQVAVDCALRAQQGGLLQRGVASAHHAWQDPTLLLEQHPAPSAQEVHMLQVAVQHALSA